MSNQSKGQILTFESIASEYPDTKYILLMPQVSRHLLTTVPMWSLDVATVKVDPNNEKQVYEIGYNSGEYGLTKVSLDALATAADLTVLAKRVDDRRDRGYAEFEAHAIMSTPSGGVRSAGRTCEWVAEIEQEKVRQQAVRWVDKNIAKGWQGCNANNREQKLEQRIAERWLSAQEFGKRMVESKAGNRAVRALLGISPKYYGEELRDKEFAVVRFVFTPDLEDREVKLMVVSAGLQAQRMLFGAGTTEQIISPTALPPANQEDPLLLPPGDAAEVEDIQEEQREINKGHIPEDDDLDAALDGKDDWPDAVALLTTVMQKIEAFQPKGTQTKLRNRLQKAIANQDGAQINSILDYMISKEKS